MAAPLKCKHKKAALKLQPSLTNKTTYYFSSIKDNVKIMLVTFSLNPSLVLVFYASVMKRNVDAITQIDEMTKPEL